MLLIALLIFASECISQRLSIVGELKDSIGNFLPGGKIKAIQDDAIIEQFATASGTFEIRLYPGPAHLIYQVPGYKKLEDSITVGQNNKTIT